MTLEHFDAVIVGSGFGGSVMAYRLAEAGKRVCVLERGQKHPPGKFPRVLQHVRSNFWDPSANLFGLYNVWFFRHLGALVSSGLGGGSLIYANVLLRKDPKWFVTEDLRDGGYEHWPINGEHLDAHYDAVEKILRPAQYPDGSDYAEVKKVQAFREAAGRLAARQPGLALIKPKLAITFANDGREPVPGELITGLDPNTHGVERRTCNLCGECIVGCNTGSKNTLDLTYLSLAENMRRNPAEIRTLSEVRAFGPRPDRKIEVAYVVHTVPKPGEKLTPPTEHTMTCDRLILAAGTFGSAHLLLKNFSKFGIDPAHVGTRFSGNGDMLSFALNCSRRAGDEPAVPWRLDPTRGPTITTALRQEDRLDTGDPTDGPGFYIQDAGFPKELAWLMEGLNVGGWFSRGVRFFRQMLRKMFGGDLDSDLGAELSELLGDADLSSRILPLLAMGRDVPDGTFRLKGGRLHLDWDRARSGEYFDRVEATAREVAAGLGGKFLLNIPTYIFRRAVTVHPLGGCPMGVDKDSGVVDSFGKAFAHDRLFVLDGSILPGPVGPNPAFTIAAIANRAADEMLRHWPNPG